MIYLITMRRIVLTMIKMIYLITMRRIVLTMIKMIYLITMKKKWIEGECLLVILEGSDVEVRCCLYLLVKVQCRTSMRNGTSMRPCGECRMDA